MKKIGILFATMIIAMLFAVSASALESSGQCGENVYWECNSSTREVIISGIGSMYDYDSYNSPFYNSNVKSITIKEGVTTIGNNAFRDCVSLTSIEIPDSVITIGDSAFKFCDCLTNITIPDGVTSIANRAFYSCYSLTSVTIPDSVIEIGEGAFDCCDYLTSITIGKGVKTIGEDAFYKYISRSRSVYITDLEAWCKIDFANVSANPLYRSTLYINNVVQSNILIPNTITEIKPYAFCLCTSLESVVLPNSVTIIGIEAFYSCNNLTSIMIPDSVITIGDNAFCACTSLKSVIIPNSVTTIGDNAFSCCDSLTSIAVDVDNSKYSSDDRGVIFDKNKTVLIQYPIGNNSLSYMVPDSVKAISSYAFSFCDSLTNISIPDSVTSINDNAFLACISLTSITIPNGITTISPQTFRECYSLTSITIPNGVTTIGSHAFFDCDSLISVKIGDSVTTIADCAFLDCNRLNSITIPNSVMSISDYAFYYCDNLKDVYYDGNEKQWEKINVGVNNEALTNANIHYVIEIGNCGDNVTYLLCKDGELVIRGSGPMYDYNSSNKPSPFRKTKSINNVIVENGVSSIGAYAFYCRSNLTSIDIAETVTSISDSALSGCENLLEITIPDNVVSIGNSAFYGCYGLKKITIPNSVTSIGNNAFALCKNLTSINVDEDNAYYHSDEYGILFNKDQTTLIQCPIKIATSYYEMPNSVITIKEGAFFCCESLKGIKLSNNVTTISEEAFYFSFLEEIVIPSGVTTIGGWAFSSCEKLNFIELPNTLTTIEDGAFSYSALKNIIIPQSVTSIGKSVFEHCEGLEKIVVEEGNEHYVADVCGVLYNIEKTVLMHYPSASTNSEYVIPDKVATIDSYAFGRCESLNKLTIPLNCKIMNYAFNYTISDVYYPGTLKEYLNTYSNIPHYSLHCSDGTYNGYKGVYDETIIWVFDYITGTLYLNGNGEIKNNYWGNYPVKDIIIGDGISSIECMFYDCEELETVMISESVAYINDISFASCNNLKKITVDEDNKYYSNDEYGVLFDKNKTVLYAYPPASSMKSYTIPNGVKRIVEISFSCCKNLKNVVLPDSLTKIDGNAFDNCASLESIMLPNSIKTIDPYAFIYCENLTDVFYEGSEEQWNAIEIYEWSNDFLINAKKHFNHSHKFKIEVVEEPTHLKKGKGIYSCECGYTYIGVLDKLEGHTYSSEVTKESTHLEEGALTYTCECGDTYDEPIAKLEEHNYVANIILPTCSEKGYTKHICECGKSYVSDYVGMIAHSYVYSVIKPSSHLVEGLGRYTCSKCGYHYDEAIAKTKEHSYTVIIINSTCTTQGHTLYVCDCGDNYKNNYLAVVDHSDLNADGVCDNCGYNLTKDCDCNCHKSGIAKIIFKIILIFQKIFKTNKMCTCGIYHY